MFYHRIHGDSFVLEFTSVFETPSICTRSTTTPSEPWADIWISGGVV